MQAEGPGKPDGYPGPSGWLEASLDLGNPGSQLPDPIRPAQLRPLDSPGVPDEPAVRQGLVALALLRCGVAQVLLPVSRER
jgi:hypothetical protein